MVRIQCAPRQPLHEVGDFVLSVQTVGYLQTASPPVLPPICRLFGRPVRGLHADRPLHAGREPDSRLLEVRTPDAVS